jgi:transcriptional regulator of acetoin/glycerol metabolism
VPNVAALGRREQSALLGWIDDPNARRQVVSTTVDPLFPLVGRGVFDEALYYRLNVILLCVEWDGATE